MEHYIADLLSRYPVLTGSADSIRAAIRMTIDTFRRGGTLYICGNGGSAADADHICGEFLKGFLLKRELPIEEEERFRNAFGEDGAQMARKLQGGLRAISLLSHPGFNSAFANDVDPALVFAQQLYALGKPGDLFLAISTGGNAVNVKYALMAAKMLSIESILLTGGKHGSCEAYADRVLAVPATETFLIQELHLPVYHTLCMAVEDAFFGKRA